MINLNEKIKAKEQVDTENNLLPEGDYRVEVVKIEPWKASKKDINVQKRNDEGFIVRDDSGKIISELVKDYVFYTADVKLRIVDGVHKGRFLFTNVTTHPNALFVTEAFLFAVGLDEIVYSEIQTKAVGKQLVVGVVHEKKDKEVTDNNTGITTTVSKTYVRVKQFSRPPFTAPTESEEDEI